MNQPQWIPYSLWRQRIILLWAEMVKAIGLSPKCREDEVSTTDSRRGWGRATHNACFNPSSWGKWKKEATKCYAFNYNQPANPYKFLGWQSKKTALLFLLINQLVYSGWHLLHKSYTGNSLECLLWKTVRLGREGKVKFCEKISSKLQSCLCYWLCDPGQVTWSKFPFLLQQDENCCPCIMLDFCVVMWKIYFQFFKRKGLKDIPNNVVIFNKKVLWCWYSKMVMCFHWDFFLCGLSNNW